jgi:hypothetical protein
VTTFESFEHFVYPMDEVEKILSLSKNIIFSTEPLPNPVPRSKDWWYYGLDHGQHISFYSLKTFRYIATKFKLNYAYINGLHVLSEKKLSNFKLKCIKLSKLGIYTFFRKQLKSKTWDDHIKMSKKNENTI